MKILDLGCGLRKLKYPNADVIGIDKFDLPGVDVLWDIEKTPFPFEDNEFDLIYTKYVLEHVNNFFPIMEELYRIVKPSGKIIVIVPHYTSAHGNAHPDHKRFFSIETFNAFTPLCRERYFTTARFNILKREIRFMLSDSRWAFLNKIVNPFLNVWKGFTEKFPLLTPEELYFELQPIKYG